MHRIILISLLLTSCTTSMVKLDETIIKLTDKSSIHKLSVGKELEKYRLKALITGNTTKQTSLVISNSEGKIYSYFIGPGAVDLTINTDWYDKECYLEVFGISKNSGELKIKYKIY